MTGTASSSHCAMPIEPRVHQARQRKQRIGFRSRFSAALFVLFLAWISASAVAAEAAAPPPPVPPEAEAAHQDLLRGEDPEKSLDEAIFTEISPLTIPEIGIRLPEDQEH